MKCTACRGARGTSLFGPTRLPHAEPCSGTVAPSNIGAPYCTCSCTPQSSKKRLHANYLYRGWVASTDRAPVTEVEVDSMAFPHDDEFVLTIREDEHNAKWVRLSRELAESLHEQLRKALAR